MLTDKEIERLREAIIATIASPMIGSIEDYSWEAIFHYVKDLPLPDPALGRSKLLYDAVDVANQVGWSLKSLQLSNLSPNTNFFFVIQRADIVKKRSQLGFPDLTEQSAPEDLGAAIIQHWNEKILTSCSIQNVVKSYEGILLKKRQGTEYVYCEYTLNPLDPGIFSWSWTTNKTTGKRGVGLQGSVQGKVELIWYKNQKQLFRSRVIQGDVVCITIRRNRLTLNNYIEAILTSLQQQLNKNSFNDNESEE